MDDCISRKMAIDAMKEHRALYCDNTPDTFSKLSYAEKSRVDELDTAIATLVNLPSAQPEQPHWIPCSERLPEVSKDPYYIDEIDGAMLFESERVLVFGKNEDGYDYAVATYIYSTAMGNEWSEAYDAAETELTQILAWMPLPKPYGGESE